MLDSLDIDATMNLLAKQAIDITQKSGFDNARNRIHQTAVDILKSTRLSSAPGLVGHPGYPAPQTSELVIPPSLHLLPLYAMALQKSAVLRGGTEIRSDERAYYQNLLSNASVADTRTFIYPRIFSIHDISSDVGLPSDSPEDEDGVLTAGQWSQIARHSY